MPRFDDLAQLRLGLVVELRHAHVKGEIARRFAHRLCHPELEAFERAHRSRAGQHISMSVVVPPTSAALLPVS